MASNVQALATSFKTDLLLGKHNFGTGVTRGGTGADTFKAALYQTNQSMGNGTTAWTTTGELANSGNYANGGVTVTNATPPTSAYNTAYWTPSATLSWSNLTSSAAFDTMLLYNFTNSNAAVGVFTFGSQSVTSGTFNLTMPTNANTTALITLT